MTIQMKHKTPNKSIAIFQTSNNAMTLIIIYDYALLFFIVYMLIRFLSALKISASIGSLRDVYGLFKNDLYHIVNQILANIRFPRRREPP